MTWLLVLSADMKGTGTAFRPTPPFNEYLIEIEIEIRNEILGQDELYHTAWALSIIRRDQISRQSS